MFAEAENEINGPTAAAYNAINLVRRRAFGNSNNDIPAGLSKDVSSSTLSEKEHWNWVMRALENMILFVGIY